MNCYITKLGINSDIQKVCWAQQGFVLDTLACLNFRDACVFFEYIVKDFCLDTLACLLHDTFVVSEYIVNKLFLDTRACYTTHVCFPNSLLVHSICLL